jgi:hypothetical protein
MMLDHRLLDLAETLGRRQAFDRDDVRPVELVHRREAARDGPVAQQSAVGPTHKDGAGAAVAFTASDLGSDQAALAAQKLDERAENLIALNDESPPIQVDQDVIWHVA